VVPTQEPFEQVDPPVHWTPQAPQWFRSTVVSTHCPPQLEVPAGQTQVPTEQIIGVGHVVPQLPQLSGSVAGVTQLAPHCRVPSGQLAAQAPAAQT
jgi:hypothetical protein